MRIRRDKRFHLSLLGAFVGVALFAFLVAGSQELNKNAEAADLANFDAGYIISDYQMSNYNSMTEAEIQAFLTSKNSCSNTSYSYYLTLSANKNYTWHWANGHFVCLSEELFGDGETIGSGETAAHIIWQAAQDYKINPQVLIVLIQKETGLITDPIPNNGDYRKATGYGCPDTAACSEKYYGFKNQVRNAAALFRQVLDGGWTNYPVGTNYVKYHPNSDCGGSYVNIKNLATSALYRYTPYQPNSAALSSGYGTGDGCSSYGNRNFYNYFEDWFGNITVTPPSYTTGQFIPDGTYEIVSRVNESNAVDLINNSSINGSNIQIYSRNDTRAQKWELTYDSSDGTYTIKNPSSGKVLDLYSASTLSGTNIQLWESNGTCAQKWKIAKTSDNYYIFFSACSSYMVLDVTSGSTTSGANLQLWVANDTNAQQFRIITEPVIEDGYYEISARTNEDLSLDISGGALAAGNKTNIQIYNSNQTQAQEWKFDYNESDGTYTIYNSISNKVLDVASGSTASGANAQAYESNSTAAQKWIIIKNSDGTYSFYAVVSGKALDVADGSKKSGANAQQWTPNGTSAQKWTVTNIDPATVENGTYEIVSKVNENLALDVQNGSTANHTKVQTYTRNNTGAQEWKLIYDENEDIYYIQNPQSGKNLDLTNVSTTSGNALQIYTAKTNTCAQKWKIAGVGDDYYTLVSACSVTKVVDVASGSKLSGTKIQIWNSNDTNAQQWKLVKK